MLLTLCFDFDYVVKFAFEEGVDFVFFGEGIGGSYEWIGVEQGGFSLYLVIFTNHTAV